MVKTEESLDRMIVVSDEEIAQEIIGKNAVIEKKSKGLWRKPWLWIVYDNSPKKQHQREIEEFMQGYNPGKRSLSYKIFERLRRPMYAILSLLGTGGLTAITTPVFAAQEQAVNIFPNPDAHYEIHLDQPEQKQVEDILKALEIKDPNLMKKLRKLPGLKPEPLDDIATLLMTATNPEVEEAFKLMIKGGESRSMDYNTELEALFKIAEQNEFKKNDTLALAIAMNNGLYLSMGTQEVRSAVEKDMDDLLNYFRKVNELQKERGYYELEDYPLEAKVVLAWTGNDNVHLSPYKLVKYKGRKLDLRAYEWITISVDTLRKMNRLMVQHRWIGENPKFGLAYYSGVLNRRMDSVVDQTIINLEEYFALWGQNWEYINKKNKKRIKVDGERVWNLGMNNVDFLFKYFLEHKKGIGNCQDQTALVDAFVKSWGIATNNQGWLKRGTNQWNSSTGHIYTNYYNPSEKVWRVSERQLFTGSGNIPVNLYIFKPPVQQKNYLNSKEIGTDWYFNSAYRIHNIMFLDVLKMFSKGVPTSEMKEWLFYK